MSNEKESSEILIRKARNELLMHLPFYAHILFNMRLRRVDISEMRMPTAAVDPWGNMIYCDEFIETLNQGKLMFVLAHEASHVGLMHLARLGNRQESLWNIATDLEINHMLLQETRLIAPDKGLFPKDGVYKLPSGKFIEVRDKCSEDIYEQLLQALTGKNASKQDQEWAQQYSPPPPMVIVVQTQQPDNNDNQQDQQQNGNQSQNQSDQQGDNECDDNSHQGQQSQDGNNSDGDNGQQGNSGKNQSSRGNNKNNKGQNQSQNSGNQPSNGNSGGQSDSDIDGGGFQGNQGKSSKSKSKSSGNQSGSSGNGGSSSGNTSPGRGGGKSQGRGQMGSGGQSSNGQGQGQQQSQSNNGKGNNNGKCPTKGPYGFDVHVYDNRLGGQKTSAIDPKEHGSIEDFWKEKLISAKNLTKSRGVAINDCLRKKLDVILEPPQIDWRHKIRIFITQGIPTDFTMKCPGRRGRSMGMYLPTTIREHVKFVVGFDCSGSIGEDELIQFISECYHMTKFFPGCELIIVPWNGDVMYDHIMEIKQEPSEDTLRKLTELPGGGTTLQSFIDWVDKNCNNMDNVIIFTDGYVESKKFKLQRNQSTLVVISSHGDDYILKDSFECIKLEDKRVRR